MKQLLLVFFLTSFITDCFSQLPVQLHLKKNGRVKKRIEAGMEIRVITKDREIFSGPVIRLRTDSIWFSHAAVGVNDIFQIKLSRTKPRMKIDAEELGYVTLGVGLTTAGLVLADWEEFPQALGIAAAIGYSPYLFRLLKSISLKKYKYRIGRRFTLRVWDIR
jgi:hypothetical protein